MASTPPIPAAEKKQRGQFFTSHPQVQAVMLGLLAHRSGRALEPSAGAGHLVRALENGTDLDVEAWELDPRIEAVCATPVRHTDFFVAAPEAEGRYDVVFGNPPYVAWREVEASTRASVADTKGRYSDKCNLYYLFTDRCIDLLADGGEMVFIVPKEWLYTTTAKPLREKMAATGAITHLIDCGEEKLFADADVPAILIFRFVRGLEQGSVQHYGSFADAVAGTGVAATLRTAGGRWMLLDGRLGTQTADWARLGAQFAVRVGVVTGADKVFRLEGDADVEDSCVRSYMTTKRTPERFLDVNHVQAWKDMPPKAAAYLAEHRDTLMGRRIAAFGPTNWWKYGAIRNARHMASDAPRIMALAKTRSATPFFAGEPGQYFGGGVLGLFAQDGCAVSVSTALRVLNAPAFRGLLEAAFLTSNDKVSLQPATLEDVPFPKTEVAALAWLATQQQPAPEQHAG